jgi:hypothetical protein
MSFDTNLIPLEKLLADLYGSRVARIIDWAGLNPQHISPDGTAIDIWHGILTEACSSGKLHELIEECIDDKKSEELKKVYDDYLQLKKSLLIQRPDEDINNVRAYVEYVECKISFFQDISFAKHEYNYTLKNFGYSEGEWQFHFSIPNATPNQVNAGDAFEGVDESNKLTVDKVFFNGGTKLILRNLLPASDVRTLRFSYDAPTTHMIYQGENVRVAYYQAELFHDFVITKSEKVIINFPKNTNITPPINVPAKINDATVIFEAYNIPRGERRLFPIFFDLTGD